MHPRCRAVALASVFSIGAATLGPVLTPLPVSGQTVAIRSSGSSGLADAQRLFYTGRFGEAAASAETLRSSDADGMAAYELRSSALLFQIKRAIGEPKDKEKALKLCEPCPGLMSEFRGDVDAGRTLARAKLKTDNEDVTALFFLGKLDLNHVWLQLGTLGRRTGWNEYWEARHSLDGVLKRDPGHVRGRVARAWIDYIVDTRMPWGTEWLFGGGDKKRALTMVREASHANADFFDQAEATFALWDMHVREKNFKEAVVAARDIVRDFPDNLEVARFLEIHDPEVSAVRR